MPTIEGPHEGLEDPRRSAGKATERQADRDRPSADRSGETTGGKIARSAGEISDTLTHKTAELGERSRHLADEARERVAGSLSGGASALRRAASGMREEGSGSLASYAESAADRLERVGRTIRERDLRELVGGLERFARREPALFFGGALLLGLLGARFVKSSASRSHLDDEDT